MVPIGLGISNLLEHQNCALQNNHGAQRNQLVILINRRSGDAFTELFLELTVIRQIRIIQTN